MSRTLAIPISDLVVDTRNPRLVEPDKSQRDALRDLAASQGKKLVALAEDAIGYGLNPSELPIVTRTKDQRYAVLEGNRRLTALRALENPDLLADAVPPSVLAKFKALNVEYLKNPVESVLCWVVDNRKEADHWIELRHTGENKGAGIVRWESDDSARFGTRKAKPGIHTQALDFLQRRGVIDNALRKKIPATSLKRLLGTPAVRSRLGISMEAGNLVRMADAERVAKALKYVVDDFVEKRFRTKDIYLSEQREQYANSLPARIAVAATKKKGEGVPLAESGQTGAASAKPKRRKTKRPRDVLIPNECVLEITSERINQIEAELRRLSLERHPNAISVLLRVFLELSADDYIDRRGLILPSRPTLGNKLSAVADDLLQRKKFTKKQAVPVRRACQKNSFLAPSVTMMHQYVHNQHLFPIGSDLRANWDSLQPFVMAIWPA